MNSIKYIGMDLHSATISTAVVNDAGKLNVEATTATATHSIPLRGWGMPECRTVQPSFRTKRTPGCGAAP